VPVSQGFDAGETEASPSARTVVLKLSSSGLQHHDFIDGAFRPTV
jgi:hypothetical protein